LETPQQQKKDESTAIAVEANKDIADNHVDGNRKRKLSESAENKPLATIKTDEEVKEDELKDVDWDSRKQDLVNLIGETPANELISFLQQHESSTNESKMDDDNKEEGQKHYTLPLISDKQVRRSIHVLIKSPSFNSIAKADNDDGKIRIWHVKFVNDMPADTHRWSNNNNSNKKKNGRGGGGGNDNRNKKPWPSDRPNFLRFVLYKENVDTTTAAKDVSRISHLNPKRGINYAGMKDKRGITTQFCSVYRIEKEQLLAVNKEMTYGQDGSAENLGGGGNSTSRGQNIIKLGNFVYSDQEVRLGTLSGNRFDIVLRNVDVGQNTTSSLHDRKQLVQQKLEAAGRAFQSNGFINYFGMQRFGKFHDTHEVGIAVLKGDFEGAVDIIMREKSDEYPRIAEARKQWAGRFKDVDVSKDENAAREAEMKCARSIIRDLGRFMNCEKSIINNLMRRPRDYKRAFGSIAKHMRSMFLHAYQSYLFNMVASHRIETGGSTEVRVGDLVLIEDRPSDKGGGGTSGLKGKSVKLVQDEQDLKDYNITDVVLPLAGSKIIYPGGSCGEIFDELLQKDGISKADFKKIGDMDRELSLGGDYRKLICKPSDVTFEVKAYKDPLQPLLQTDLMKVKGIDVDAITLNSSSSEEQAEKSDTSAADTGGDDTILFAMICGFSLPPSSYATIALRELTKRPTVAEYQSKLEMSGKCERNINL